MPVYKLVPDIPADAAGQPGFVTLDLPDTWRPAQVPVEAPPGMRSDATSFPIPTHRAEAMRLALLAGTGATPALLPHWRLAVRALVAGVLQPRRLDLRDAAGAFGACISALEPDSRHPLVLEGPLPGQRRGIFALTHPDVLVWTAARRTPADWDHLKAALEGKGQADGASTPERVLAELQALMERARCWSDDIPWMRGLRGLIGEVPATPDLAHYGEHARGVGPVPLRVVDAEGKRHLAAVWLPVVDPGWGALVRRAGTLRFRADGARRVARDAHGQDQLAVMLPSAADDNPYVGTGEVLAVGVHPPEWEAKPDLTLNAPDGLFESAGAALYPPSSLEPADVRLRPWLYPDPLRVLVRAVGPAGVRTSAIKGGGGAPRYGRRPLLEALLRSGVHLPTPEQIQAGEAPGLVYRAGAEIHVYVDDEVRHGAAELREIGHVLWRAFLGEAEVVHGPDGAEVQVAQTTALRWAAGRLDPVLPLPPADARQRASDRLATLQRFSRAWKLSEKAPSSAKSLEEVLAAAAWSWVRWLRPGGALRNGAEPRRHLDWPLTPSPVSVPIDVNA